MKIPHPFLIIPVIVRVPRPAQMFGRGDERIGDGVTLADIGDLQRPARAMEGIAFHPVTGDLWASEHGPQGGDEVNIIQKGGNYGWPDVSYGRDYDGTRVSQIPWKPGMLQPEIFWVPSIGTSGMMFYTGDQFPQWQNHLFVGSLMTARVPGTGHVERIAFN